MEEDITDFSLAMFERDIDLLYDEIKDLVSDEEDLESVSLQSESRTLQDDSSRSPVSVITVSEDSEGGVITLSGSDSEGDKFPAVSKAANSEHTTFGERILFDTCSTLKVTSTPSSNIINNSFLNSDRPILQNKRKLYKLKTFLEDAMKEFIVKKAVSKSLFLIILNRNTT